MTGSERIEVNRLEATLGQRFVPPPLHLQTPWTLMLVGLGLPTSQFSRMRPSAQEGVHLSPMNLEIVRSTLVCQSGHGHEVVVPLIVRFDAVRLVSSGSA